MDDELELLTPGERFVRQGGWTALLLVLGMLTSAAWAILAADWTDNLHILVFAGWVAVLAGTALGISRFGGLVAHLFSIVYGSFWVTFLVAATGYPDGLRWFDRVNDLSWRVYGWAVKALSGGVSSDRLMFVLLTAVLFWLLGYTAGWYTFRYARLWRATLPVGILLLLTVYYYYGPADLSYYLLAFLLLALLYIVRVHLSQREAEWRRLHVTFSPDIQYAMLRAGLVIGLVMLMFAWGAPSAAANSLLTDTWAEFSGPYRRLQQDWQRLFSALRSYSGLTSDAYGTRLNLGGPISLGDEPVFDVYAPRLDYGRLYWRAVAFDTFDGNGWRNTDNSVVNIDPGESLRFSDDLGRAVITQTLVPFVPASTLLYGAQGILSVDRPVEYTVSYTPENSAFVSIVRARSVVHPGQAYTVLSSISQADPVSLARAGTDYPDWLVARYLQLPESTTARTRELAAQITRDAKTPYAKAVAIEEYLRANITYTENVEAPPEGVDGVDYLLFDVRKGYCNYYASAMVVMLRSLGVPARFAAGYAHGEFNADTGAYRVRARDAHAWPEVFFSGYGWVEFEPTAAQDPIERPEPPAESENGGATAGNQGSSGPNRIPREELEEPTPDGPSSGLLPGASGEGGLPQVVMTMLTLLAGAVVVGAAGRGLWWLAEERGLRGLSPAGSVYGRLLRYAQWAGLHLSPAQTPHERASAVVVVAPAERQPITRIADLYVAERFGRSGASPAAAGEADALWSRTRPALLRAGLRRVLARFQRLPRDLRRRRADRRWR